MERMYYRNSLDKSGSCSLRGESAENAFIAAVKRKKFNYRKASVLEQYDHIDWFVEINDKIVSFDVKARKKTSRNNSKVKDDIVWVEYQNVSGNKGWLKGKADIIALERENDFVLVPRKDLLRYCDEVIEKTTVVHEASQALYKLYSRDGRKDIISMIRMDDVLYKLKSTILRK
jgi:hypothetical protein